MLEIVFGWIVWSMIGLVVATQTIWWLAPVRRSPVRSERINAWGHTAKMGLATTVHILTLIAGKFLLEAVLDAPDGWNWSITTEGTARGILIYYAVFWAQIVLTSNAIILRLTWRLADRAELQPKKGRGKLLTAQTAVIVIIIVVVLLLLFGGLRLRG